MKLLCARSRLAIASSLFIVTFTLGNVDAYTSTASNVIRCAARGLIERKNPPEPSEALRQRFENFVIEHQLRRFGQVTTPSQGRAPDPGWVMLERKDLDDYVGMITPGTIEIIAMEEHLTLRINNQVYGMWDDGIYVRDFQKYIEEKQRLHLHPFGANLPATPEEKKAIMDYFYAVRGTEFKRYSNNCSQNVCRALKAAGLPRPISIYTQLIPALAAKAFSEKNPAMRVIYFDPQGESPQKILAGFKSAHRGAALAAGVIMGVVSIVPTIFYLDYKRGGFRDADRRRSAVDALDANLKDFATDPAWEEETTDVLSDWLVEEYPQAAAKVKAYAIAHPETMKTFMAGISDDGSAEPKQNAKNLRAALAYIMTLELEQSRQSKREISMRKLLQTTLGIQLPSDNQILYPK